MLTKNQKGKIAEFRVAQAAVERGFHVLMPLSHDTPYDLVIDDGSKLYRVQVKFVTARNGVLVVQTRSSTGVNYKAMGVDKVAAYSPDTDKVYWIDLDRFDRCMAVTLRLTPTKNNQASNVFWASEFEVWIGSSVGRALAS